MNDIFRLSSKNLHVVVVVCDVRLLVQCNTASETNIVDFMAVNLRSVGQN